MSSSHSTEKRAPIPDLESELQMNLEIQTALNAILKVALDAITLEEQFHRTLELIFQLPWMRLEAKGCIYLVEGEPPKLVMKTHVGLPESVCSLCAQVPFGSCLCGQAIALNEVIFSSGVDCRHDRLYPGMEPHGHYCVPIVRGSQRLGLLNLYVQEGHQRSAIEERFMNSVADVLAGMIERSRVEQALWRSEERFELAVQATDIGIWDWDLRSNALHFSTHWKQILGYEDDEIEGRVEEWIVRLHPEDKDRALATVREFLEGNRSTYELVHRLRHKDGSYRWILARGGMVRDEAGKPCRFVGSHLDISEQKRVEKRLGDREASLMAARRLLEHLVPQGPYHSHGLLIQGSCFAADYAPGDFFDYFTLKDGSVMVVIADVSGHGIESALLMSSVQARLRSYAELSMNIEEILRRINTVLFQATEGNHFVTMLLLHIDPRSRTLTFANAGHPSGYLFNARGQVKHAMDSLSLPVALDLECDFPVSAPIPIESGDMILLITDGVLEARSPAGTYFGLHRTLEVVRKRLKSQSGVILDRLHKAIHVFTGTEEPQDDETIVLVRVR